MTQLKIVTYPDKFLKEPTKPVENIDGKLIETVSNMGETMYAAPGIGLAAPQVGVGLRVIVIDELGFIPFSSTGAQLLFQLCSALYERVALIVTTNLKFADWTQVFGDERLTLALLDRLTHRAHIIEFVGESYRFRERLEREEQQQSVK